MNIPNRYSCSRRINGGFGEVLICDDLHLKRTVAIKLIKNPDELHRLRDELNALLSMRSNHVVQVYDLIFQAELPVGIIEEYISGEDLCESTVPQQSEDTYIKTLWQIASGIADIHSHGIIHRDIKPNNMKYDAEGIVKIFDFGLSRTAGGNAETTGYKGTFEFSAPELLASSNDEHIRFTQAIDTYAFGIMVGYLVDRRLPKVDFVKTHASSIRDEVLSKTAFLPTDLQNVVASCLSVKPSERPEMSHVRDLIAKHLLKDKHQSLSILKNEARYLNKDNKRVKLSLEDIGSVVISYDGFRFYISEAKGEVYINNKTVSLGDEIPAACVVTIGAKQRRWNERAFIPFDVSHPEVVL